MRSRILPVVLLALVLTAALGGAASAAVLLDAPDYTEPTDCYTCHSSSGAAASSPVTFAVGAVDKNACATCHAGVPLAGWEDHFHNVDGAVWYPNTCGGAWGCHDFFEGITFYDMPAGEYVEVLVATPYGRFQTTASPNAAAGTVHGAHAGTGWVATAFGGWGSACLSCHGQASCSACHTGVVEHGTHGGNTCVSAGCHTLSTSGVAVPTCASCHPAAADATHEVSHSAADGSIDGIACSDCHSLDMVGEHAKPASSSAGASCAACHPTPAASTVPAWDGSCVTAGCHTASSTAPMHAGAAVAHGVSVDNAMCLDCHAGTDLGSIHTGALDDSGRTACFVCHTGVAGEPATSDCTVCHFTFESHYDQTAHTSSWTLIGCGGEGCHTTRDLMGAHQEKNPAFTCDGCHKDFSVALQIDQGLTGCGDCHAGITQTSGHRDAHEAVPALETADHMPNYAYYTGSVGTPKTTDCAGCHTSNLVDEHLGLFGTTSWIISPRFDSTGAALTCASCHSSSDSIVLGTIEAGLSSCESCHQVHGPIAAVHAATFDTSAGVDCAQCHSNQLEAEHNGTYTTTTPSGRSLTGCAVCHSYWEGERGALIESVISATGQTQCSACHATQHPDLGSHTVSAPASQECAVCHDEGGSTAIDVKAIHAGAELGACAVCHNNALRVGDLSAMTAECASCHATEGSTYHRALPGAHTYGAMDASCTGTGCHVANTLPEEHERFLVGSGYDTTCALCHENTDPLRIAWTTATAACSSCHTGHGDITAIHTAAPGEDCFGCHGSANALELHVDDAGQTVCATCHNATTTLSSPITCGSCHAIEGADYHLAMSGAHTYGAMDASCTGTGCHVANTLPEEHERFLVGSGYDTTCALCHENTDPLRIAWTTATAACSSCHTGHGDITAIHTAAASQACVDCHETGDTLAIHKTDAGETDCAMCHSAPAGRIDWSTATIECVSCHGALSPVDPSHYPLAAHDASAETGCNQCHYMDMKAEHFKSTVAVTCVTCHEVKVDSFTAGWDKTCAACHPTNHGDRQAKHTSTTTACGGSGCHNITDVADIHGAVDGPGCGACHISAAEPATTTDCTASGCHAGVGTDHRPLHESASVNPTGCSGCHFMNLVDEHEALGFTCDTCHKSTVSTVVSTIAADDLRCKSCHPGAHGNHSWEFNPGRASLHKTSADLPGMRSSFVVNGTTYTWSLPSASTFLKTGWTTSSMMACSDCHSYSGATGPHGATMKVNIDPAYPNPYRVTTGSETYTAQLSPNSSTGMSMTKSGSTTAKMICEKCHDLYNGSTWSNVVHKEHGDRGRNGAYCNSCHIGLPHGWSRPRMIGYTTDSAPYATYTGGVQRISLKSYSPNGWSKSDCGAGCSSSRHPISGSSWPATDVAPPAPTTGTVSGTVKDSATNAAIAGATVSVAGKTATSGSTGAYTVADITEGTYTMTVSATGYDAWSGSVTVTAGQTATADATLTLTTVAPTATNIARTGTASASSTDGSNYASRAIDGNTSSYWRSSSGGTQWLRVDLASAKTFDKVVVNWDGSRYAKAYRIETSNDGSSWTSRYSTSRGSGGTETITFSSVSARYVRIYMTTTNDSHYRITEFEVWGY